MKSCDQGWWKVNEIMYVCVQLHAYRFKGQIKLKDLH